MKDEIKEILDNLDFQVNHTKNWVEPLGLNQKTWKELLNYITNLQDTLKDREEYCYGLETQITNLQEENERLTNARYSLDRIELEDIINKAIEKIKKIQENAIKYGADHDAIICQDLLNILKESDKDE